MNPALQGYLAAVSETLADAGALADAAADLRAVESLVDGSNELSLALNDAALSVAARRAVLDDLLDGKVRPEVRKLVAKAVTVVPASELIASFHWLASETKSLSERPADERDGSTAEMVLGRLASRNRVTGYAAGVFETLTTQEIEEVEDQLFRFTRTVESNRGLRGALGDRDIPVSVRQGVIADLIGEQALPATQRLAAYAVRGGRARDIVGTLDAVVVEAARARGWRVARVSSAEDVVELQRQGLGDALAHLTGSPVELQVTIDPALLGGVVVQVGDLLVDGSARHRLDQLKEHLLISEDGFHIPEGREES
ncbi:MAG: F-type H+-transporting ATPase subunit delta [Acidimicrobiaceae bacterium]|nr:F-type H+-transporting ATPase subunit delta [Acidimicrobiaceae bacterium]